MQSERIMNFFAFLMGIYPILTLVSIVLLTPVFKAAPIKSNIVCVIIAVVASFIIALFTDPDY